MVLAVPEAALPRLKSLAEEHGTSVTAIGRDSR